MMNHHHQQQPFTLCPEELFPYLPNHLSFPSSSPPPAGLFPLFTQWELTLQKLAPIFQGKSPTIFVSHAWHEGYYRSQNGVTEQQIKEAIYYDLFDLLITKLLKEAGFEVFYDMDLSNTTGIIDQGANPFMKTILSADIIIAVCTPLYKERSTMVGTGVHTEVECIKERLQNSTSISFFIPVLIHASNPDFPVHNLLVGQELEKMQQVIYISLRDATTFISNIWRILFRLWKNTKGKWESTFEDQEMMNLQKFLQQYVSILGELLQYEDYYDSDKRQSIPHSSKEVMKNDFYSLRILTTLTEDIRPDTVLHLLKEEMILHKELFTVSNDQDIVAVLGNTGVGKSTLINFLVGKGLKPDQYKQSYELINENDQEAFKIGNTIESETIYPQCVRIGKILYFDLPGFMDSNGSIRDLINAAFIYQIMILAKSIRFIFLIGQDEITAQRGKILKKLFSSITNAFQSQETVLQSSMLVITKSNFKFPELSLLTGFLHTKLSTTVGAHLKQQLEKWQQSDHINHLPHPQFDDISNQSQIRDSLLQSIEAVIPMKNGRDSNVLQFNLSGFYPPEVSLPLLKMFSYLIQEESLDYEVKSINNLLPPISSMVPVYAFNPDNPLSQFVNELEDFAELAKEYNANIELVSRLINQYLSDEYWRKEIWPRFDERLNQKKELKLLKDISFDIYEQAKVIFQRQKQEEVKKRQGRIPSIIENFINSEKEWQSKMKNFQQYKYSYELFTKLKHSSDADFSKLNTPIAQILNTEGPYNGKIDLFLFSFLIEQENVQFITKDIKNILVRLSMDPSSLPSYSCNPNDSMVKFVERLQQFEAPAKEYQTSIELVNETIKNFETDEFWTNSLWKEFEARAIQWKTLMEMAPDAYEQAETRYQIAQQEEVRKLKALLPSITSAFDTSYSEWQKRKKEFQQFEASFTQFLKCKVVYEDKANQLSAEFPVSELSSGDPFNGKFDLSKYDHLFSRLTIRTGFNYLAKKKEGTDKNHQENQRVLEVVLVPRFLLTKVIDGRKFKGYDGLTSTLAVHWPSAENDVAIFFFIRPAKNPSQVLEKYRYNTTKRLEELSSTNLHDLWESATMVEPKPVSNAPIARSITRTAKDRAYATTAMVFLGPCIGFAIGMNLCFDTCTCLFLICGCGRDFVKRDYFCWKESCCGWDDAILYRDACPVCRIDGNVYNCCEGCKDLNQKVKQVWENAILCVEFNSSTCPVHHVPYGPYVCCWECFACCVCPCSNLGYLYGCCIHKIAKECCLKYYDAQEDRRKARQERQQQQLLATQIPGEEQEDSIIAALSHFTFKLD